MAADGRWLLDRTAAVFRDGLPWCPGAREALATVRASGLPTALVTSTYRELTEVALDTIGREFFDVVVCGDEVPATKPDPAPYLRAAELLDVDPPPAWRWRTHRPAHGRRRRPARWSWWCPRRSP